MTPRHPAPGATILSNISEIVLTRMISFLKLIALNLSNGNDLQRRIVKIPFDFLTSIKQKALNNENPVI